MKKTIQILLTGAVLATGLTVAHAETVEVKELDNLKMCVDYSEMSRDVQQTYFKELDRRGQLSYQDHSRLANKEVGPSSTTCGMYMAKGKPLTEKSRQIRPMTFKVVHVYSDMYYVSQSGMVVEGYERKEGVMPPKLSVEKPDVQAPPVLYGAPK